MPLTDLGIDPDTDLADQYPFTKTTASDANGVQRGSTWQCCPGLLVYRRDIALDTFGTDDPAAVGEKVKDWDTFKATAEELKAKGYYALASYADTFRLYGNSISQPWGRRGHRHHHCRFPDHAVDQRLQGVAGRRLSEQDGQGPVQRRLEQVDGLRLQGVRLPAAGLGHRLHPGPQLGRPRRLLGRHQSPAGVQLGRLLHSRLHRQPTTSSTSGTSSWPSPPTRTTSSRFPRTTSTSPTP